MSDQNNERECWWAHLTFCDVPYDAFSSSPAEALKTLRNGILHDQSVAYDPTWFDIVISAVTPIRLVPRTFFKNGETNRQVENAAEQAPGVIATQYRPVKHGLKTLARIDWSSAGYGE